MDNLQKKILLNQIEILKAQTKDKQRIAELDIEEELLLEGYDVLYEDVFLNYSRKIEKFSIDIFSSVLYSYYVLEENNKKYKIKDKILWGYDENTHSYLPRFIELYKITKNQYKDMPINFSILAGNNFHKKLEIYRKIRRLTKKFETEIFPKEVAEELINEWI